MSRAVVEEYELGGPKGEVLNVIFETDLGNDVDDALAMDMLFKYADEGKINLLGIGINKNGTASAEFADILCNWYKHGEVPIAVVRDGAFCDNDGVNYAAAVCHLNKEDGTPMFERYRKDFEDLPEATTWYRKTLSEMPDHSVTIVSVGFSTNLARLLRSEADEFSPLNGEELISQKVKRLVTMGGRFDKPGSREYNIIRDIPSAKTVFEDWPTEIVTSPFETGKKICYPASSIEDDFAWATEGHPMVEAYKAYMPMPYDRPTWDPTALLYAVEGGELFSISDPGDITVSDDGVTTFTPTPNGSRRYLSTSPEQDSLILNHLVELISRAI